MDKCLDIDSNHERVKIMKAALIVYLEDRHDYESLTRTKFKNLTHMRSFPKVFSLNYLPELHFNWLEFFDSIVNKNIYSKPFYEFCVWTASLFNHLIKAFKKGYVFNAFTGLPEDWY